jgi:UDP-N-acetylglucosamine diphosphorylase/glucosamine-1-phosphate N-acetyltransferase
VNIVPVVFEDHNLARMRPLTWSIPVFEMRCGMFNTRERVRLCTGRDGGVLLGRAMLRNLHNASGWEWGAASVAVPENDGCRFLVLNGMLAPDFSLIRELLELSPDNPDFVWRNGQDLIAALVGGDLAGPMAAEWEVWEQENARQGVWADPAQTPRTWTAADLLSDGTPLRLGGGGEVMVDPAASGAAPALAAKLEELEKLQAVGPAWIWDIVGCTRDALSRDLAFVKGGLSFRREPFGVFPGPDHPAPDWSHETTVDELTARIPADIVSRLAVDDPQRVFCGEGVDLAPGTAVDTAHGPVILDRGVRVMPHCYLEGPLYIGPGSLVKPGARIFGESSFGIVNRLAGEIGESTFGDFANKQHEGFIGHAVMGSWVNLGAMTTCSDLKNNYGEIRVDLGSGALATGRRFVGLMMGDHAKTAIGALFNTGTCVGFASNIFGAGMPPKFIGNFQWGGQEGCPRYAVDRAQATAEIVMSRRGCRFTGGHGYLFNSLGL